MLSRSTAGCVFLNFIHISGPLGGVKLHLFWSFKRRVIYIFCIFFGGLECVGHSFVYVAHFVFLRYVWILNPGSGRSKQARYANQQPSPYRQPSISLRLATRLPTVYYDKTRDSYLKANYKKRIFQNNAI